MAPLAYYVIFSLLILQLNSNQFHTANAAAGGECSSTSSSSKNVTQEKGMMKLYPLIDGERVKKEMLMMNETRRKLGSFQLCAPCTCCGPKGYCLPSPCCYAINCNIPNRPFGFCSFIPKTCNCFGCHL